MQCTFVDDTFLDRTETVGKLGEGSYGEVKLVKVTSGEYYAIKYIKISENGIPMDALKETDALVLLRSAKEVIHLYGICQSLNGISIIMEPAEIDLWNFMRETPFSTRMSLFPELFSTFARIVRIFRKVGLTHYDISPKNILVKNGQFKIADFGMSMRGFSSSPPTATPVYVLNYRPPEYLFEREFETFKSYSGDIWAMGLILVDYIQGYLFYSNAYDEDTMRYRIYKSSTLTDLPPEIFTEMNYYGTIHGVIKIREKLDGKVEPKYIDLIEKMLNLNPNDRPTSLEMMKILGISMDISQFTQPEDPRAVDENVTDIAKFQGFSTFNLMTILMTIELYTRYLGIVGSEKHPWAHLAALRISSEYNARGPYEVSSISELLSLFELRIPITEVKAAEEDLLKKLNFSIFRDQLINAYSRVYYQRISLYLTPISEFAKPLELWFKV